MEGRDRKQDWTEGEADPRKMFEAGMVLQNCLKLWHEDRGFIHHIHHLLAVGYNVRYGSYLLVRKFSKRADS